MDAFYFVTHRIFGLSASAQNSIWKAQWITHTTEDELHYGVFVFRKQTHLTDVPTNAWLRISADNEYKHYVNGQRVEYGTHKGDLDNKYYQRIDIAPFLKNGENTIAVQVSNMGIYKGWYQVSHSMALVAEDEGPLAVFNTNKSWKVARNPAFHPYFFNSLPSWLFRAMPPSNSLVASQYPWGWEQAVFNDKEWPPSPPSRASL